MENEMETYLRQYQAYVSNLTDQPSAVFNTNYQTISDQLQFSPEQLREKLRKQLEYYFSRENMINDVYLQSQMDADNYVPISTIANFKLVKRLTHDLQLIIDVLKESPLVEVDIEEKKVRPSDNKTYQPTRKRCIIILRNVPLNATKNEILELFINESCSVLAIGCERVLELDHSDCWYVTFNSEDDAQNAFLYLTRENISIRGQKILARMKACLWQKPPVSPNDGIIKPSIPENSLSISTQEQYTPVYIQSVPTSHTNPSPFLRNISQQHTPINYRPRQIIQQQHLPINYNVNILSHQHNVPSTFPFATNSQQINMNYYPQTQYINRNHPIFPTNVWYIPSTIDSYSPMTYNGIHKPKTRLITPKLRNSTKPISNHEKINHLLNSSQNNASHLEDNSSSIHHTESLQSSSDTSIIDGYANQSTSQISNTDKLPVTNE